MFDNPEQNLRIPDETQEFGFANLDVQDVQDPNDLENQRSAHAPIGDPIDEIGGAVITAVTYEEMKIDEVAYTECVEILHAAADTPDNPPADTKLPVKSEKKINPETQPGNDNPGKGGKGGGGPRDPEFPESGDNPERDPEANLHAVRKLREFVEKNGRDISADEIYPESSNAWNVFSRDQIMGKGIFRQPESVKLTYTGIDGEEKAIHGTVASKVILLRRTVSGILESDTDYQEDDIFILTRITCESPIDPSVKVTVKSDLRLDSTDPRALDEHYNGLTMIEDSEIEDSGSGTAIAPVTAIRAGVQIRTDVDETDGMPPAIYSKIGDHAYYDTIPDVETLDEATTDLVDHVMHLLGEKAILREYPQLKILTPDMETETIRGRALTPYSNWFRQGPFLPKPQQ